jgi:uncharacterized protein DUF4244
MQLFRWRSGGGAPVRADEAPARSGVEARGISRPSILDQGDAESLRRLVLPVVTRQESHLIGASGMTLLKRIALRAKAIRAAADDLGMTTAEYAVGTVAAAGPCAR